MSEACVVLVGGVTLHGKLVDGRVATHITGICRLQRFAMFSIITYHIVLWCSRSLIDF